MTGPGNVRELLQTIEQLFTSPSLGPTCFSIHLPEKFRILQLKAGLTKKNSTTAESRKQEAETVESIQGPV